MEHRTDIDTNKIALTEWVETADIFIDRMRDFFLPPDFPLDYTAQSLAELEQFLLDVYSPTDSLPHGGDLVESAIAYLGETAIRTIGGGWANGPDPLEPTLQTPYVVPDPALHLSPLYPLRLLVQVAQGQTGQVITAFWQTLAAAVAAHPGWIPPTQPGPGLEAKTPQISPELVRWLEQKRTGFDHWIATHTDSDPRFDFTRDSLLALETLLRRRPPNGQPEVPDPDEADLIDGAAWYFGEVLVRNKNAVWINTGGDPVTDTENQEPYVHHPTEGSNTYPRSAVRLTCDPALLFPMRQMFYVFYG
jgi:hypothetical protein